MPDWIERELAGCSLPDARLDSRLAKLVEQSAEPVGQSTPLACQDWAGTKAAYRLVANPRVDGGGILAGHSRARRERFDATENVVLVYHDMTEFSFQGESTTAIGVTMKIPVGGGGRSRMWELRERLSWRGANFVEVEVPVPGAGRSLELVVGERVVRLPAGFDAGELRRLLAVLERPC